MTDEQPPLDGNPDMTGEPQPFWEIGMFRDHRCYRCNSGERACVRGNPRNCEFPHARND
jgi:hypothetical protein